MPLNLITVQRKLLFIKQNLLKALTWLLLWAQSKENKTPEWFTANTDHIVVGISGKLFFPFLSPLYVLHLYLCLYRTHIKRVSRNLIKQWRSGCPGNHWEQVALVKIAHPVCAKAASFPLLFNLLLSVVISLVRQKGEECKWGVKGIRSVHLAPGKVRHLEEWFGLLHVDYTVTLLIHWVRRAVTERDTYMM